MFFYQNCEKEDKEQQFLSNCFCAFFSSNRFVIRNMMFNGDVDLQVQLQTALEIGRQRFEACYFLMDYHK